MPRHFTSKQLGWCLAQFKRVEFGRRVNVKCLEMLLDSKASYIRGNPGMVDLGLNAEGWKEEHAVEERRWSRRWRDALSWFISNSNKVGISSSACLICEYAEHPTSDSSPLIKAWLGAQVAIAHLYENTWWWFYTQSSFTMERVPEPGWCWQVPTVGIPQASVVQGKSAVQVNAIVL